MALSKYEKMIIGCALAHGIRGTFNLRDEDILLLAQSLRVDQELLLEALNLSSVITGIDNIEFKGEIYSIDPFITPLFDVVISYYFIRKSLSHVVDNADETSVIENIRLLSDAVSFFEMMNMCSGTSEAEYKGKNTYEYNMYDDKGYRTKELLNLLISYNNSRECFLDSEAIEGRIRITQVLLKHELLSRSNAVYLAALPQIISHYAEVNSELRFIAQEFYLNIISKLRNAKVLAVQTNLLYQNVNKDYSERTKEGDNTTRLKIIYGFDNFDTYTMRLDLAHQGEGFTHFNNQSPGKVKCCLFSKEEYERIIEGQPVLSSCFISYGERFALKERNHIPQSMKKAYEEIRSQNEHKRAFVEDYSEESVIEFVNYLGNMLPPNCETAIRKDSKFDDHIIDFNQYMMMLSILFLALLGSDEDAEKMYSYIVEKMSSKNIISDDERALFASLGDICEFAELMILRSRLMIFPHVI